MKKVILILFHFIGLIAFGQIGVIRGKVIDKQSETILSGATVELIGNEQSGVITDGDGNFVITNVPVGRQSIKISFIGYEPVTLLELEVSTGKDVQVNVNLLEAFDESKEVVLTSERSKILQN